MVLWYGGSIISAISKEKRSLSWKRYQDNAISDIQYKKWKKGEIYDDGMASIEGRLWPSNHEGKYLLCTDYDNKKRIEQFLLHCFPES